MNKILVFTNKTSWRGISDSIRDTVDWDKSYPKETNPLALCVAKQSGEMTLQLVDNISEEGVYFVYDAIDYDRLSLILNECPSDYYYILIHSKPNESVFSAWDRQSIILKSMHENFDEKGHSNEKDDQFKYYYYHLFKILIDNESDKTNRIIKKVFMETIISNFTDGFRYPNNNSNQFRLAYNILRQNPCLKDYLDDFMSLYEKSDNRSDYIDKLNALNKKFEEVY